MTIECYKDNCKKHSANSGDPRDEGPFCYEAECEFDPRVPAGYTAEELDRDNPYTMKSQDYINTPERMKYRIELCERLIRLMYSYNPNLPMGDGMRMEFLAIRDGLDALSDLPA